MNKVFLKTVFPLLLGYASCANSTILLRDNFEYIVDRNTQSTVANFTTQGPWTYAKTVQNGQPGARGYLYTTTTIPGFSGNFPGSNSNRVLAMEILPASLGGQTDVYLGYGNESFSQNAVPANVWFQYWIYVNRYGAQMSRTREGKWIYPSYTGTYPATNLHWLYNIKDNSMPPYWESTNPGEAYIETGCGSQACTNRAADEWDSWKLGHNRAPRAGVITPNRWNLIKIHFDTTGTDSRSPGQGIYEMWINNVKVAEWIGRVTPQFTWPAAGSNGHKAFRMPTTVDGYDQWIYMDDFVMATAEASLPVYGNGGPLVLTVPGNLHEVR